MKVFSLPSVALRPESWVPGTVASYQSWNWDLDNAYVALNEWLNTLQPGTVEALEKTLVAPAGGEPIKFQQDIFGPLGDRITVISDFTKPIKSDNQRILLAVALDDSQLFRNTLNKLVKVVGATSSRARDFRGTTIVEFDLSAAASKPTGGAGTEFKGALSVAIAGDTVFLSTEPTLLEQVLRGGVASLAKSPDYLAVARYFPDKTSSHGFVRPAAQSQLSYDTIKSGSFAKSLDASAPDVEILQNLVQFLKPLPMEKLPDFSVFAKYYSPGGSYMNADATGFTFTRFDLHAAQAVD